MHRGNTLSAGDVVQVMLAAKGNDCDDIMMAMEGMVLSMVYGGHVEAVTAVYRIMAVIGCDLHVGHYDDDIDIGVGHELVESGKLEEFCQVFFLIRKLLGESVHKVNSNHTIQAS